MRGMERLVTLRKGILRQLQEAEQNAANGQNRERWLAEIKRLEEQLRAVNARLGLS